VIDDAITQIVGTIPKFVEHKKSFSMESEREALALLIQQVILMFFFLLSFDLTCFLLS